MSDSKQTIETLAEKLLPDAALQRAMEYPIAATAHGATIYAIPQGWENEELKADPMLKTIIDSTALEEALRKNASKAFYIPNNASLTVELIRSILERNGSNAAVFLEQTNS